MYKDWEMQTTFCVYARNNRWISQKLSVEKSTIGNEPYIFNLVLYVAFQLLLYYYISIIIKWRNIMNTNDDVLNAQYANSVSLSHSAYEVRMEFFVETPNEEQGDVKRNGISDIRVSPQLAKEMVELLKQTISSYEDNVGKIPSIKKDIKNE